MIALLFAVAAIFMFHHVSPTVAPGPYARALTTTPDEFRLEVRWLLDHGCALHTVSELIADEAASPGQLATCDVALSFDDGYDDAYTYAQRLLERDGVTATFYIATGLVGTAGHLSARQLQTIGRSGMEIGAHSVHHADLTTLSSIAAAHEINDSKRALERLTGARVQSFAYPAGRYDSSLESDVRQAGYSSAVTTEPGTLSRASLADAYALPRYRMLRGQGVALFASVLGAHDARDAAQPFARALHNIARERAEGNDLAAAERVGVALLEGSFEEQILKVKTLNVPPADVAGIMLSGVKMHAPVSPQQFQADVGAMIDRAFAADGALTEVDVWAVVPIAVGTGVVVSGDYAAPTNRTVYSIAAQRSAWDTPRGKAEAEAHTYWDPAWRAQLASRP